MLADTMVQVVQLVPFHSIPPVSGPCFFVPPAARVCRGLCHVSGLRRRPPFPPICGVQRVFPFMGQVFVPRDLS